MKRPLTIAIMLTVLAACGSGEQADTQPALTENDAVGHAPDQSTDPADAGSESDTSSGTGNSDSDSIADTNSDTVTITEIDDIPAECRQIMGDFLREIEPMVDDIDWDTATVAGLQEFEESFDEPSVRLEQALASSGGDVYDFGPDEENGLEFSLTLAREEAPGVVGYLEFIRDLFEGFDPDIQDGDPGLPTDCDGAIAFVSDVVERTDNLSDLPVSEYVNVTAVLNTIQFNCPPEQAAQFYEGPAFAAWVAG